MSIKKNILKQVARTCGKPIEQLDAKELYEAVSSAVMRKINETYVACKRRKKEQKSAYYMSAEFLVGRAVYANLKNLGIDESVFELLQNCGIDKDVFEQVGDAALGNGGLGRLAACFLDSAATLGKNLDGYGIRYRYGLFKQKFEDGFQREYADDWLKWGDPWSIRVQSESVRVEYKNFAVNAVPYDTPVIGFGGETVNTLRLWQSEPICGFDFRKFDEGKYASAYSEAVRAENICAVLYPNDSTAKGRKLRLIQQYFFTSASVQDIIARAKREGRNLKRAEEFAVVQLNDTHPTLAIPEFIRLLEKEGFSFDSAFETAQKIFAYTNHTVMSEALEKWETRTVKGLIPQVYAVLEKINERLKTELREAGESEENRLIISDGYVHMANLACYVSKAVNGVAHIHTEIIKADTLKEWYSLYPDKFFNETNGITQRRWLLLANPRLSQFVTELIGDKWITDLNELEKLKKFSGQENVLNRFYGIKRKNKRDLSEYIKNNEGIEIPENFIFDVQIKRLHEYKRQLLNAFSIVAIYNGIKDGSIRNFRPTAFIFGAKAAPAYTRAQGIIKYINEIAKKINSDDSVNDKLRVVFVTDYNVSYAEKIVAAADVSEQISAAGTEASGTGNMKLMLNGAVTLGTYDGANIEIAESAGEENEYIFGARAEELFAIRGDYDPKAFYESDPILKAAVDTLVDGTFSDGGSGIFKELYDSLLVGASWHRADNYFLFKDFAPYMQAKLKVNADYGTVEFIEKCFINTASAGRFSSDRTVLGYCRDIWGI